MKKKLLGLIVLLCLALTVSLACAETSAWLDGWTWDLDGSSLVLKGYMGSSTELTIPATAVYEDVTYTTVLPVADGTWVIPESATSVTLDGVTLRGTDCSGMFSGYANIQTVTFKNMSFAGITSMKNMFSQTAALTSVTGLKTPDVTNMEAMFMQSNISALDISGFTTDKVTTTRSMFHSCKNLTSLDITKWNLNNVKDAELMFFASGLTRLDLSNWNNAALTVWYSMFDELDSLTTFTVGANFSLKEGMEISPLLNNGLEWVSSAEKKVYTTQEIIADRSKTADTYTRQAPDPVAAPTSVSAKVSGKKITISWKKVNGASAYAVYRVKKGSKNAEQLAVVGKNVKKYVDTEADEGKIYTYYVKTIKEWYGANIESSNSNSVNAVRLASASNVAAKNSKSKQLKITWKKVTGAKSYEIYLSTNAKKPSANANATLTSKKASATVKKLKVGTTYRVYVRPVTTLSDGTVVKGDWSSAVKVTINK